MTSRPSIIRICQSAGRLRWAVFIAMAVMISLYIAARFELRVGHASVEYQVHGVDSPFARYVGDLTVALLMIALYQLTEMLRRIAAGDLFGPTVVANFRSFAQWLLVMSLVDFIAPVIAQLSTPTGVHQLRLTIDFRGILTVGVTLLIFLLSGLLERARAIDEEMREIV